MPKTTPHPSTGATGTRWILLVDDESSIRQLIEAVLVSSGFSVKSVDSAQAAVALVKAESNPPTLLICDVVMPDTDGLALARQMRAKYKNLKVIFISGKLDDAAWWPADLSGIRLLQKPFANADLLGAVNESWSDAVNGD